MTVSLLEILAAARAHAAPLAAESAGYLLLAVVDHLTLAPRVASADGVELQGDGSIKLRGRHDAASAIDAERVARRLLARALEVSSSVGPALRRAAERRESTGLEGLVRELEVALIPVNRSAARRALSRLHRETERARDQGKLDALLRAELEPAPAVADAIAVAADFPQTAASVTPAPVLPVVQKVPAAPLAPAMHAPVLASPEPPRSAPTARPMLAELSLSPPPLPTTAGAPTAAEASSHVESATEPSALTKPEPVVERARVRASSTPKLGTVITAQTLPGEEHDRTERAPSVVLEDEGDAELVVPIEVELEAEAEPAAVAAGEPEPLLEPSPSCLPDVVSAMLKVHAGIAPDEAPTRLRDVVTALRPAVLTPEPQTVDDGWLTQSSLEEVTTALEPSLEPVEIVENVDPAVHEAVTWCPAPVSPKPAAPATDPAPPLAAVVEAAVAEAAVVEAAVVEAAVVEMAELTAALEPSPDLPVEPTPLATSLLIAEPVELSPYAPAVLPVRESDVSELLDSFHVTSAVEERELRAALKEMAGLDVTPLPHPFARGE